MKACLARMKLMNEKILIDTSVLVRAYDNTQREVQLTALTLLDDLVSARKGLISTGILLGFTKL